MKNLPDPRAFTIRDAHGHEARYRADGGRYYKESLVGLSTRGLEGGLRECSLVQYAIAYLMAAEDTVRAG